MSHVEVDIPASLGVRSFTNEEQRFHGHNRSKTCQATRRALASRPGDERHGISDGESDVAFDQAQ
ncbi:MAG: hypothetical protein ABI684_07095 [Nitrospirota bacterium]